MMITPGAVKRRRMKWLIGGFVVTIVVIAMSFLQLGENTVYFYTPDEAVAKAATLEGSRVKIGGMVKTGTVAWDADQVTLKFIVSDLQGHDIAVTHRGAPPDMFKEGGGVVVEGRLGKGAQEIVASRLMVKHSEEYKKPDTGHSLDPVLLQKSILKDG